MAMSPRLLRPRASGFNPKSIANLGLWLDASADSSLTFNATTVSEWRDLSGNGRHFAQAVGASQPVANTRTQNGRRALDFQGGQRLNGNASSLTIARNVPGVTILAVAAFDVSQQHAVFHIARNGADGSARALLAQTAALGIYTGGRRDDGDSILTANSNEYTSSAQVFASVINYQGAIASLFFSGVSKATANPFHAAGSSSDTDSNVVRIGDVDAPGTNFQLDGFVAEIIVYQRALSATERQRVERYLGRKWGITVA